MADNYHYIDIVPDEGTADSVKTGEKTGRYINSAIINTSI